MRTTLIRSSRSRIAALSAQLQSVDARIVREELHCWALVPRVDVLYAPLLEGRLNITDGGSSFWIVVFHTGPEHAYVAFSHIGRHQTVEPFPCSRVAVLEPAFARIKMAFETRHLFACCHTSHFILALRSLSVAEIIRLPPPSPSAHIRHPGIQDFWVEGELD